MARLILELSLIPIIISGLGRIVRSCRSGMQEALAYGKGGFNMVD